MRPREGFSPTSPQKLAGILIEPPPSLRPAIGTIRAATAAAAPPLEPAVENARFHGFRVAPYTFGSVVHSTPISGELVMPNGIRPAARKRRTDSLSRSAMGAMRWRSFEPLVVRNPATCTPWFFSRYGTPPNVV